MQFDRTDVRVIARTGEWVFETGLRYAPRMVLTAGWSDAAADAWKGFGARELELNYARGWQRGDLSFLAELPGLRALLLTDWNLPVGELSQLFALLLGDLVEIASIRPPSRLRKLEKLFLLESTSVADGDLSPLLALPELEHVVFEDRPHYSHRAVDFAELPTESIVDWREQATRAMDERILGPVRRTGRDQVDR